MKISSLGSNIRKKGESVSLSFKEQSEKTQLGEEITKLEQLTSLEYKYLGSLYYKLLADPEGLSGTEAKEVDKTVAAIKELMQTASEHQERIAEIDRNAAERKETAAQLKAQEADRKAAKKAIRAAEKAKEKELAAVSAVKYAAKSWSICSGCGAVLMNHEKYCPHCGKEHIRLICPSCGTEVEEGNYCTKCGQALYQEIPDGPYVSAETEEIEVEHNASA